MDQMKMEIFGQLEITGEKIGVRKATFALNESNKQTVELIVHLRMELLVNQIKQKSKRFVECAEFYSMLLILSMLKLSKQILSYDQKFKI